MRFHDDPHPLVRFVLGLDRAARSKLRRSLSFPLGTWPQVFPIVEPFAARSSPTDRRHAYLVAGLMAWCRSEEAGVGDMGAACARLRGMLTSDAAVERRFITLLDADVEGLTHHLRQIVALFAQYGVTPDWSRLLSDLRSWSHPDRWVQQRWARSYYAAMGAPDSDGAPAEAERHAEATEPAA